MGRLKLSKTTLRRIKHLLDRELFRDRSDLLDKAVESLYKDQLNKDCAQSQQFNNQKKKTEKS